MSCKHQKNLFFAKIFVNFYNSWYAARLMRAEQMQLFLVLFQSCIRIICIWCFMAFDHRLHRWSYQPGLLIIVELYIKKTNNHLLSNKWMSLYWSYLISKTKSCGKCVGYGAHRLLCSYWSAGGAVPRQMDLAGHAWPSVTSWLQLANAAQSLGITGKAGGQVDSLRGTFLQSFLYICLQLRFKIAPRGLAQSFGRCGRNSANNMVEPDLNAGNFSQASWKTEVHVMNLLSGVQTVTRPECLSNSDVVK